MTPPTFSAYLAGVSTGVRQHIRRPSGLRRPGRRAREPFVAPKTRVPWFTSQGHLAPLVDRRNQGLPEAVRSGPLLRLAMRHREQAEWPQTEAEWPRCRL